ncbi:hypothetical protein WOLCODRAFT_69616 [Wolfiporia cocos MD-104 SS10]|uniref:Exonuclease domain-containing protein n=1 Tax=Wolfiporia cocos (strain MD-104) TaxID=742152 RepID=A0A2H3JFU4_WOLCO|nr:hypothetical protein WOLCODRAFT_69616 [Wolfiporia cocos MD-104 SS10]
MFSTVGLFESLPCPEKHNCRRVKCLFNHRPGAKEVHTLHIPVEQPAAPAPPATAPVASSSTSGTQRSQIPAQKAASSVPAKRPLSYAQVSSPNRTKEASNEPPRKLQRTGPPTVATGVPTAAPTSTGCPVLRVSAAHSYAPIPVRQSMLKNLYDHFCVLYKAILPTNPTLASEHSLRQEEEVYKRSNKHTYRNAVISSIAALKRRAFPDSASHASVGTEGDLAARAEAAQKFATLRLTRAQLVPYVLSLDDMRRFGYVVEVPPGEGGAQPADEGAVKTCERCAQPFMVKRKEEADECVYHWGKAFSNKVNGEKRRLYTCCSRPSESEGCERGPHVFYESAPEDLHRRHPFSYSHGRGTDTTLDVVALDCEMVYTTGGMRVARVSVVDAAGKEIFDEFVRMDDGVEVIDFNTRFSGITPELYASARLPLASVRASLDTLIGARTVIIGHALENDLKTLRMIHHCCVDTAVLFPHPSGPPYRRALRTLAKEFLGKTIQSGGGTVGHSSVEDSIATLDLVRWHVLNRPPPPPPKAKAPAPEVIDVDAML